MNLIILIFLLCTQVLHVSTHDILILQPFGSRSHRFALVPIAKQLGQHGHQVTFVSTYSFEDSIPANVTEIAYTQFADYFKILQGITIDLGQDGWSIDIMKRYYNYHSDLCQQFFESRLLQNWISSGKLFKIVIIDSAMHECILPLWSFVGQNIVIMNTGLLNPWVSDYMNVPTPFAYIPFIGSPHNQHMDFFQRFVNTVYWILAKYVTRLSEDVFYKNVVLPYFPNSKPHRETLNNISLALVNIDPIMTPPSPSVPNVIRIGGIQCRPPLPLPEGKLKNFVDSSDENGFILFSFGSVIDGSLINEKLRNTFIAAFAQIKQRVVWKYESQLSGLSNNVMTADWLPQQDLLGHPKIRAVISHGGLQSLQESIYHAVPSICFPFTTDQPSVVEITSAYGIVIKMNPYSVTVEEIVKAIDKACKDEEMRKAVQRYSKIFHDREEDPLNKAIFWIEYVMRHDGAMHLQTAAVGLNFFQYNLLDVSALAAVIVFLTFTLCYLGIKRLIQTLINQVHNISFKLKMA
nr:UDP-glycosyltransferase 212B1 [Strigamia maritima]